MVAIVFSIHGDVRAGFANMHQCLSDSVIIGESYPESGAILLASTVALYPSFYQSSASKRILYTGNTLKFNQARAYLSLRCIQWIQLNDHKSLALCVD